MARPLVIILSDGSKESFCTGVFLDVSPETFEHGILATARHWDGTMESQVDYFNGRVASNDGVCLHLTYSRRKGKTAMSWRSCSCET